MLPVIAAGIGAAGSLLGGVLGSRGASRAANAQVSAANQAQQVQREMFDINRADLAPWRQQGANALRALRGETGLGAMPQGYAGFQQTPGFQFEIDEGMRQLDARLAAMGLTNSGAGLRARQEFGQGLASRDYGNHLARLQSMAGLGQTSAGMGAGLGAQFAGNMGNIAMQRGQAQASGFANQANAWGNALSGMAGAAGFGLGQMGGAPQQTSAFQPAVPAFGAGGPLNSMIPFGGGWR